MVATTTQPLRPNARYQYCRAAARMRTRAPPACIALTVLAAFLIARVRGHGAAPKNTALRDAVAGRGGQAGAKPKQLEKDFWQSVADALQNETQRPSPRSGD